MKAKIFVILLSAALGASACSSSREGQSSKDSLAGDTSSIGALTDTVKTDTIKTDTLPPKR